MPNLTKHDIELQEGDKAVVECNGELFGGVIELRMVGQWPDTREALFFTRPLFFPWEIKDGRTDVGPVRKVH